MKDKITFSNAENCIVHLTIIVHNFEKQQDLEPHFLTSSIGIVEYRITRDRRREAVVLRLTRG